MKRSFWAGFVTALLVCTMVGTAYAATGKVTQELEYKNIQVTLDGNKLDLRDSAGQPVEPFQFGENTYLPVEALAEALGLSASWDEASGTVKLSSMAAQLMSVNPSETAETADAGRGMTVSSFLPDASAKKIALDHAGLKESAVTGMQVTLGSGGAGEYKVQFTSGGASYTYIIDALSSEIIDFTKTSK